MAKVPGAAPATELYRCLLLDEGHIAAIALDSDSRLRAALAGCDTPARTAEFVRTLAC
jgi:hypothetical protein